MAQIDVFSWYIEGFVSILLGCPNTVYKSHVPAGAVYDTLYNRPASTFCIHTITKAFETANVEYTMIEFPVNEIMVEFILCVISHYTLSPLYAVCS